ncbi:uncharacterized protein UBRO2_03627 [Ustilago bromivora]|uniref:Thioesterase domain-containing protein n=1 Tax=Ustilago bromivora TaxID=307758 RepID=A0A8H8QN42_9BASI|nr:uncharacterized protein UBRO2_03627 [Ustilago bromivora]
MASNALTEGVVTLKMINELQQQVLDNNPIYKYLLSDLTITHVAPGLIEAQVPVSKTLMNSKSILHGSTSATIIDWIGGIVIASTSPDRFKNRGVSVDIHVTYVGAAKEGDLLLIKGTSTPVVVLFSSVTAAVAVAVAATAGAADICGVASYFGNLSASFTPFFSSSIFCVLCSASLFAIG